ncbi:MAG: DegT/DnrJ/EryC1/StrS family aminotransferase, partial [Pseudonocardiaceae bacterium]
GKILSCGEGGYLLTNDSALAARAASWRNHGLTPAPGITAGSRIGHNFRLAQPLAALARHHLAEFDTALTPATALPRPADQRTGRHTGARGRSGVDRGQRIQPAVAGVAADPAGLRRPAC